MQIKVFSIPVIGGEALNDDLNSFLRSKKIVQVEQQLVQQGQTACWSFCIRYTEDYSPFNKSKEKPDYKEVLGEVAFKRFLDLREIRKKLAKEESLPAYAIFTDEELSAIAKIDNLTMASLESVEGIGPKKVEKFGVYFIQKAKNEKG